MSLFRCTDCDEITDSDDCCMTTEAFEKTGRLLCDDCSEKLFEEELEGVA